MMKAGMKNSPMATEAETKKMNETKGCRAEGRSREERMSLKLYQHAIKEKRPGSLEEPGRCSNSQLLWCDVLVIAQVVDILKLRSSRRQVARAQEQDVKVIVSWRRTVHVAARAILVCPRVVLRVVHADQRSVVEQTLPPQVLK